jgi:hypothetical protein
MKTCWLLPAIALLFSGCMHTSYVSPETPSDSLAHLNQNIARFSGSVTTHKGDYFRGERFRIGADSTSWCCGERSLIRVDSNTWKYGIAQTTKALPNREIRLIDIRDRTRGLREGVAYGVLTGAAIGAVIGTVAYLLTPKRVDVWAPPDAEHQSEWLKENEKRGSYGPYVGMGALAGGAVGVGVGVYIGGGGGRVMRFTFSYPPQTK